MVKSAEARIATTQAKIQPHVVYLRYKALLRNKVFEVNKNMTVATEKDIAAKALIDAAGLNMRERLNAWECWRELYYTFYASRQTVVKNG